MEHQLHVTSRISRSQWTTCVLNIKPIWFPQGQNSDDELIFATFQFPKATKLTWNYIYHKITDLVSCDIPRNLFIKFKYIRIIDGSFFRRFLNILYFVLIP